MSSQGHFVRRSPPGDLALGLSLLAAEGAPMEGTDPLGMDLSTLRLAPYESWSNQDQLERLLVLLTGAAEWHAETIHAGVARRDIFSEAPTVLHVASGSCIEVRASAEGAEFALARTGNAKNFPARLYAPKDIVPEYRGAGLVQNTCLRNVRLVFDRVSRPESNFVIGEVINYPGRWSSYPPHHHDQPEIYHYRFTQPEGYGHAELGDEVYKIRPGDTVVINAGLDHAQVSAPGYGMYYLWLIRHLPGNPYTGFTFAEEHKWALDKAQQGWIPPDPNIASR